MTEKRKKTMMPRTHHPVLDLLIQRFELRNDAHLADVLGFEASYLSRVRSRNIPRCPAFAIAVHEVFGLSFKQMRELSGDDFVGVKPPSVQGGVA